MLTKEQCLSEELNPQSSAINLDNPHLRDAIFYGMQLFAKEIAIAFLNFDYNQKIERLKEQVKTHKSVISPTPEELFELFLQSINQK